MCACAVVFTHISQSRRPRGVVSMSTLTGKRALPFRNGVGRSLKSRVGGICFKGRRVADRINMQSRCPRVEFVSVCGLEGSQSNHAQARSSTSQPRDGPTARRLLFERAGLAL